jgi:glutamyl-tRNA synthetase
MYCLKDRARSLPDLIEKAQFVLAERPIEPDEKSAAALDDVSRGILSELTAQLQNDSWSRDTLEAKLTAFAESHELKFGKLAAPIRAALAGRSGHAKRLRHDARHRPGRNARPPDGRRLPPD